MTSAALLALLAPEINNIKILTAVNGVKKLSVGSRVSYSCIIWCVQTEIPWFFSDIRSNVIFSFLKIPNVQSNVV